MIKVIVILDVPCGKLQFRVFASNYAHSGQLLVPTLNGFPQGVTLRPWALLRMRNDAITISPGVFGDQIEIQ